MFSCSNQLLLTLSILFSFSIYYIFCKKYGKKNLKLIDVCLKLGLIVELIKFAQSNHLKKDFFQGVIYKIKNFFQSIDCNIIKIRKNNILFFNAEKNELKNVLKSNFSKIKSCTKDLSYYQRIKSDNIEMCLFFIESVGQESLFFTVASKKKVLKEDIDFFFNQLLHLIVYWVNLHRKGLYFN